LTTVDKKKIAQEYDRAREIFEKDIPGFTYQAYTYIIHDAEKFLGKYCWIYRFYAKISPIWRIRNEEKFAYMDNNCAIVFSLC